MNDDTRVWGIHTQDDKLFLTDNKIAIGWHVFGNLSQVEATRTAFKERYIEGCQEGICSNEFGDAISIYA